MRVLEFLDEAGALPALKMHPNNITATKTSVPSSPREDLKTMRIWSNFNADCEAFFRDYPNDVCASSVVFMLVIAQLISIIVTQYQTCVSPMSISCPGE